MTTNQAIALFRQELAGTCDGGEIIAITRMVMKHVLNYDPVDMILRGDNELPDFAPERLSAIIARLKASEPIQYVLGVAQFHGHTFEVTRDTLIPRPETEQLVDMIVDENPAPDLQVLDVGTGSGCIAVSLALALKFAQVTALDISGAALAVARRNATACKARIKCVEADIMTLAAPPRPTLDIVVSNPPYVCESERGEMEANVLDYEPDSALFVPDADPLKFYQAIARYSRSALKPGGRIYLEINCRFGKEIVQELEACGFVDAAVHRDTWGNDRFVSATREKN